MIAQVVPLRRFPANHPWFDYRVPPLMALSVGQLVTVPFLNRQVPGIVWALTERSDQARLKKIIACRSPQPVMTSWQRSVCQTIAAQSFVSPGHVLLSIIPTQTTRYKFPIDHRLSLPTRQQPSGKILPAGRTWWYRERAEAILWIRHWLASRLEPAAVITPTIDDCIYLHWQLMADFPGLRLIHSQIKKSEYLEIYEGVRQDRIRYVIGTARAMTLPYQQRPDLLIDQEEHPAHKQTEQHPRSDIRRVLESVQPEITITTPAPSMRWWIKHRPRPPAVGSARRILASLDGSRRASWLSDELADCLEEIRVGHGLLMMVAPQRGYASSVSCRDCQATINCRYCLQRLRLFRQSLKEVVCRQCGRTQSLPSQCTHCHGLQWDVHGWGTEYLTGQIRQHYPGLMVDDTPTSSPTTGVIVDTYRGYRRLRRLPGLTAIAVVNGDALLNYPDFSSSERAWQFLARLQAEGGGWPIIVQTFNPESDFWQRWRRTDDGAWYQAEENIRRQLLLPPVVEQWIARYPSLASPELITAKIAAVNRLGLNGLTATGLPLITGQKNIGRILLTARKEPLAKLIPVADLFPFPWQLDTSVASWLD